MEFSTDRTDSADAIVELFTGTFTASESAEEGELIGNLVRQLLVGTPAEDVRVFTAWDSGALVGGIFFTRLSFEQDSRTVFMMSPVAVATARQRQGIGQRLISYGLEALRQEGVDVVVTYGDPNFYCRVGFQPVSEAVIPAPCTLQQPQGWLAQSLNEAPLTPVCGPAHCVAAFNNPALW